jgi:hypothetical protein
VMLRRKQKPETVGNIVKYMQRLHERKAHNLTPGDLRVMLAEVRASAEATDRCHRRHQL